MQKIIYSSPNKIDWDAQSAFKITNYYTEQENCMVFCYLKQYVQQGSLKLCTFCFDKEAIGKKDLQLCLNLNPSRTDSFVHLEFGIDGINSADMVNMEDKSVSPLPCDGIEYRTYPTNDQQGYYWCGEITFTKEFCEKHFDTYLYEKSIILLNFYKIFDGMPDKASLFPDESTDIFGKSQSMQEFVVLNY